MIPTRYFPLLFLFVFPGVSTLQAQIEDDFSDGNFTADPAWSGDVSNFVVNPAEQLQLMAPGAGTSFIYTQGDIADSTVWEFDILMDFAPSGSNLLRMYLFVDQADLSVANGYFLEIGETGSDDPLQFYRLDTGTEVLLQSGVAGGVAVAPVDRSIRVRLATNGDWLIEMSNGGPFELQASINDPSYSPAGAPRFFGFECNYTASRVDQFYFDNISILPDIPDMVPPVLTTAEVTGSNEVTVTYDEVLDPTSAENTSNYTLTTLGNPSNASLGAPGSVVVLTFASDLSTGDYTLESNAIADTSGNISGIQTVDFSYVQVSDAAEFDILINEFMADPEPVIGLPAVEWLELYNRSDKIIDLASLTFADGTSNTSLPTYLLYPDSFVVLIDLDDEAELAAVASNVLGVDGFPTLNNSGEELTLTRGLDVIDQLTFSTNWHTEEGKESGGWTLERINPETPCLASSNWQSCPIFPGGTPGVANASLMVSQDQTTPFITAVFPNNATNLEVTFSEGVDLASALDPASYNITPALPVQAVSRIGNSREQFSLTLSSPLQTGAIYEISTNSNLLDCSSNASTGSEALKFGLTETAFRDDVLINEIMADPTPSVGLPEVEWIELYNRSDKIINLGALSLSIGGSPKAIPNFLFFPGTYVVLLDDSNEQAFSGVTNNVLVLESFSSLTDGGVELSLDRGVEVIDQVEFSKFWHSDSDKEDGGWTLERINPETPCLGSVNWQSCPVIPGGTPGEENASLNLVPDETAPFLIDALPIDEFSVLVRFSEGVELSSALDPGSYSFDPTVSVVSVAPSGGTRDEVLLSLASPLDSNVLYELSTTAGLVDCSGNQSDTDASVLLGLPKRPEAGDFVINEVLFNPAVGGKRFIELYNQSNKAFLWTELYVANFMLGSDAEQVTTQRLFLPGQYMVLTEEPNDILARFDDALPDWILEADLPSLGDREGNITVYWSDGVDIVTVDSFDYLDTYHNPIYTSSDREGVSLERIRTNGDTQDPNNWTSAAGPPGGPSGTPTQPNSQGLEDVPTIDKIMEIPVPQLSPDDDGYQDFLDILYKVPAPGYSATITIFDSGGIPVRNLVRQDLVGIEGSLRWDGEANDLVRVRPGIYIVFAEFFHPDGTVTAEKVPVAVLSRM